MYLSRKKLAATGMLGLLTIGSCVHGFDIQTAYSWTKDEITSRPYVYGGAGLSLLVVGGVLGNHLSKKWKRDYCYNLETQIKRAFTQIEHLKVVLHEDITTFAHFLNNLHLAGPLDEQSQLAPIEELLYRTIQITNRLKAISEQKIMEYAGMYGKYESSIAQLVKKLEELNKAVDRLEDMATIIDRMTNMPKNKALLDQAYAILHAKKQYQALAMMVRAMHPDSILAVYYRAYYVAQQNQAMFEGAFNSIGYHNNNTLNTYNLGLWLRATFIDGRSSIKYPWNSALKEIIRRERGLQDFIGIIDAQKYPMLHKQLLFLLEGIKKIKAIVAASSEIKKEQQQQQANKKISREQRMLDEYFKKQHELEKQAIALVKQRLDEEKNHHQLLRLDKNLKRLSKLTKKSNKSNERKA